MANIKHLIAGLSLGITGYQLWSVGSKFRNEETPEIFRSLTALHPKAVIHVAGTAAITLLTPKFMGLEYLTLNPVIHIKSIAVAFPAALGYNYAVNKIYEDPQVVKTGIQMLGTTAIAFFTHKSLGLESTTANALIILPAALIYNSAVNLLSDNYFSQPNETKKIGVFSGLFSFIGLGPKMLIDYFPDFANYPYDDFATYSITKLKNFGYEIYDSATSKLSWIYESTGVVASAITSAIQNSACSVISTVDEIVNLSPYLYKVAQTKDYVAVYDFKTISTSLVHVVGTMVLTFALPKTPTTKYAIIGLNIAVGWLEGDILNSVAGLQTVAATTKLGQLGYYFVEGGVLFANIGINHNSYVKQYPGAPEDFAGSYQMMKADAFAQNCTYEDQYHLALQEYLCPAEN